MSEDTIVVGAFYDDDNGDNSGSEYVFIRDGGKWDQQAKLSPIGGKLMTTLVEQFQLVETILLLDLLVVLQMETVLDLRMYSIVKEMLLGIKWLDSYPAMVKILALQWQLVAGPLL